MSAPLKFYADLAFTRSSISGAQKQLSSAFNSANVPLGGVKSFDHALGRLSGRASEFQKSMDAATARVFAFGAAVGVINAVAQSFKQLALATVDVEKRMTLIGSIFNRSSSTLNKFREDMFSIAKNTGQSFAVVADAATELARQGLTAEETTKRLSDALILSRISGLASADAVKTLTSAINGFNEAGFNSAQVINKLIAVDNNFAISAKDLSEALSRVGSTAQDAGVSLDELLGLVTAVQQKTQRGGAVIGNAFKTIFAKTSDFEVIQELQKLGVAINSSQTGVQKLFAISKGLEEAADPAIAAKIKQLTGNIYQLNVVSAALKDISQDQSIFADATERASKASNEAYIQNDKLGKTTSASFAELVAGVTNLAAKIGEITLQPTFKAALNVANNFVEFLDKQFDPERGSKLFQLFFQGIGTFLSGPGLAIVGLAFARILQLVVKFAREGARELLSLSDVSRKNVLLQQDLVNFLAQDSKLRKLILSDATTMAQKEQLMFKAISDGNIALAQRAQIMKTLANSALIAGVAGFNPKKGFVNSRGKPGAVPNYAKEYPGLKEAILREVTGTGVKPHQVRVSQSSRFATPNNPAGMVVTNTRDEPRGIRDIPNYALDPRDESIARLYRDYRKSRKEQGLTLGTKNFSQYREYVLPPNFKGFPTSPPLPTPPTQSAAPVPRLNLRPPSSATAPPTQSAAKTFTAIQEAQKRIFEQARRNPAPAPAAPAPAAPAPAAPAPQPIQKPSPFLIPGGERKIKEKTNSFSPGNSSPIKPAKDLFANKFVNSAVVSADKSVSRALALAKARADLASRFGAPSAAASSVKAPNIANQRIIEQSKLPSSSPLLPPASGISSLQPSASITKTKSKGGRKTKLPSSIIPPDIKKGLKSGVLPKPDAYRQDIESQRQALLRRDEAAKRNADLKARLQAGASQIKKADITPKQRTPFLSDKAIQRGQAVGSATTTLGFAASFAVPAVTNKLNDSKSKDLGIPNLTKALEKLEKKLEKERLKPIQDEKAIEKYEKEIKENQEALANAKTELESFSSSASSAGTALTVAAFALPQLLSAGGKAAQAGLIGLAVAAAAAIGTGLGTGLYKFLGTEKILEDRYGPDKENEAFNRIADDDYIKVVEKRLKDLGATAKTVAETLNSSFTVFRTRYKVSGDRADPRGRLFSELGASGTKGLLERASGLKDLAQEFLPENLRETPEAKVRRESLSNNASIDSEIRNVFGELAQGFGSFSDETKIAEKRVAKLEEAFGESFGDKKFKTFKESRSFLEQKLKEFSLIDPNTEGRNGVLATRANAVLRAREELRSAENVGPKVRDAEKIIGQEQTLFNLFKSLDNPLTKSTESAVIASITDLARTIDSQIGDGSSTKVSDLVKERLEERRKMENDVIIARKRMEFEVLAKQKKTQEKLVERLKGIFGQNVDSLGEENLRGSRSAFRSGSVTDQFKQTKSTLSNLNLNEDEISDLTSKFVTNKGLSFEDIFKTESFTDRYKSIFQSGNKDNNFFSDQFRKSAQEIKGEDFLKRFQSQDIGGARFNSPKGVFDFVKLVESGKFDQSTLANSFAGASSSIRRLESARSAGNLTKDQSGKLDELISSFATYVSELGKRGEIFSVGNEKEVLKGIKDKEERLAKNVDATADSTLTGVIASLERSGVSLSTSVERVTTSIMSSSDSIAASLKAAADKLNQALADIGGKPSGGPKPTTAAATVAK